MNCYDYAIKFIYRTPKTEQDLRIKLFQKGYSSDEVAHTMEILKHKKYIDDEAFAQMYINSEVIRKGKPLVIVSQKLRQKGIEKELIKKVIRKNESDITE
ncbi:recombination regulator RecX [Patescibacteria group bacterium]|nr:recombination regulator RecX [Patescibacteria group bacterium]MBU1759035.1 recombination regulator RecX [Patescibacteria group bacterium]